MASAGPKVIGHRGAPTEAPENTMAAFVRALELGAHGIELDVQLSRDGHPVVIHDAVVDRTTDGSGPVFDHDLAALEALDAGRWFDPGFAGESIPHLDEVLALPAEIFELEIKTWGRAALDAVLEAVDRAGVLDRVKFTGWDHALLRQLKLERPTATIGLFSRRPEPWMTPAVFERDVIGTAETAGFDVGHVYVGALTPAIADGLRAVGYDVHAADVGGPDDLDRAIECGAWSVTTDRVASVLAHAGP